MHVRNLQFWIGLTALAVIATGCGGDDPRPKRLDSAKIERFLTEDASTETAMVFGELYRNGAEWKFRAVGQGYATGLAGIARDYGVNIG